MASVVTDFNNQTIQQIHNLKAHPRITIQVSTHTFPTYAQELIGPARAQLWSELLAASGRQHGIRGRRGLPAVMAATDPASRGDQFYGPKRPFGGGSALRKLWPH